MNNKFWALNRMEDTEISTETPTDGGFWRFLNYTNEIMCRRLRKFLDKYKLYDFF